MKKIITEQNIIRKLPLRHRIKGKAINIITSTKVDEIIKQGVVVERNGEKEICEFVAYDESEAWGYFHEFLEFEIEAKLHKVEKFD